MPYHSGAEDVACACGAIWLKQGALPPSCKSQERARAWIAARPRVEITCSFSESIKATFADLALLLDTLARDGRLEESLNCKLRDLRNGVGVNKLWKIVTVPASGTDRLALEVQPSDELLSLIATLRALQGDGDVVHDDKATTGGQS